MSAPGLPDVNVLVALTNPAHEFHLEAHRWLAGTTRYATTPVTELGLLRVLLNPAVTGQTVEPRTAQAVLAGVRADDRATFLPDDTTLASTSIETTGLVGHRQVTDFHLVGLAARHGAVLVTFDRRLARSLTARDAGHVMTLA